jgi:hypothetical protein
VIPPVKTTSPILTADYPMFPSVLQNVSIANVTVTSPSNTLVQAWEGNLSLKTGQIASSISRSLPALVYEPGWLNFSQSTGHVYQLVSIDDLDRRIEINGQGKIFITDAYIITNHMPQAASSIYLNLPMGARNVTAYDPQGNSLATILVNQTTTTYGVSPESPLEPKNSTQFTLDYSLLPTNYISETGTDRFDLNIPVTTQLDSVVGKLTFEVSLPEGASIKDYPSIKGYDLRSGPLEQEIVLTAYNVSSFNNINLHMSFVYSIFWASFYPTLWVTTIVAIGLVLAMFWRAPKPTLRTPRQSVVAKPQTLKGLVSSYEERTKALLEIESLEQQAQKGRLPRRRYKVRKRMLESQISRLDRELVDLKQRAKSMGPRYAEILKDVEIAEAELEGIEVEERRAMARYRAGAYTLDAYRRMQEQYNKRREKAKETIEGALLRLSEGIT